MADACSLAPRDVTLGILAGGRATRLGGIDKAWLQRDGRPQVLRLARSMRARAEDIIVSANHDVERYAQAGLRCVTDVHPGIGPLGGLHALCVACGTPWLLTVPVDAVEAEAVLPRLLASSPPGAGARIEDVDGLQPLVALWRKEWLRERIEAAIRAHDHSVQALQDALRMSTLTMPDVRLGNLNTPVDLAAAGIEPP